MVLLSHLKPEVIQILRPLILENSKILKYSEIFDEEISRGLSIETEANAFVKAIVTHINKLPNGKEEGNFLGLDFSGPKIKIMLVKLENGECTITRRFFNVPCKLRVGKSEKLFDFIAECLFDFMLGITLKASRIPLGVTFGFPIEQTSLQDCTLLRWTQGFNCKDLVGRNIFTALKNAFRKYSDLKKIFVIGILSDAVSAVLSTAWKDPTCRIGTVIGYGVSCCYAEKVDRVTKYQAENYSIRQIYMNLESSNFGGDGNLDYLITDFDREVDESSENKGEQLNEKLTSLVYFGELVRVIMIKCIENKLILNGIVSEKLGNKDSIKYEHLKRIESDPDTIHTNCKAVLQELGYDKAIDEDCFQIQFICRCVSRRAANLAAAQLATIINRIGERTVTIATDGELINNYPNFKWYLNKKLKDIKKISYDFRLIEAGESGLGPAVMAAVFGEDVMNRDEKFRRLPGFPMDNCHFAKERKFSNSNKDNSCNTSNINPPQGPLLTSTKDLSCPNNCPDDAQKNTLPAKKQNNKCCSKTCKGYNEM